MQEASGKEVKSHTWNTIGRLTGSDPAAATQVILLTAHVDHLGARASADDPIYDGADDDASGSTAVLELAETLAKGPRPKRTTIFAWFGSEESGGYGARHFKVLSLRPYPVMACTTSTTSHRTIWRTSMSRI